MFIMNESDWTEQSSIKLHDSTFFFRLNFDQISFEGCTKDKLEFTATSVTRNVKQKVAKLKTSPVFETDVYFLEPNVITGLYEV